MSKTNKLKTLITFFIVVFASFANVFGQISLTRENNTPRAEYRYLYDSVSFDYVAYRFGGADTIWDFSEIDIYLDTLSYYYTRDSTYISFPGYEFEPEEFPCAEPPDPLDTNILRSDNAIYRLTDSLFYQNYQVCGIEDCICNTNIFVLRFPFSYGSHWSQERSWWSDWSPTVHNTITTQTADAYGSLILPDTTYTDVLRLFTDFYYEINYISVHHWYWQKKFIYEWYHEDFQLPLLKLEFMESLKVSYDSPTWSWDTTAWLFSHKTYVPLLVEVADIYQENDINIYPSPVNSSIHFTSEQKVERVALFNLLGVKMNAVINKESQTISVAHLQSGIYILRVRFENGREFSQKVIIAK